MAIVARFKAAPNFERLYLDAAARDPKVRAAGMAVAGAASASAKGYAAAATGGGVLPSDVGVAIPREIHVLPTKDFRRRTRVRGSLIPVALVVSDHPLSKWAEYGRGVSFGATRFMRRAAQSIGARAGVTFKARGRR